MRLQDSLSKVVLFLASICTEGNMTHVRRSKRKALDLTASYVQWLLGGNTGVLCFWTQSCPKKLFSPRYVLSRGNFWAGRLQHAKKHQPRATHSHAVVTLPRGWALARQGQGRSPRRYMSASCSLKETWGSFTQHGYAENTLGANPGVSEVDVDSFFEVKRLQNGPFSSHMEGGQELKVLKEQCFFHLRKQMEKTQLMAFPL